MYRILLLAAAAALLTTHACQCESDPPGSDNLDTPGEPDAGEDGADVVPPGEDASTEVVATGEYRGPTPAGREGNRPPTISSEPTLEARQGEPWRYDVSVEDPDGDPVILRLEDGPEFVVFDGLSASLTWTPAEWQAGSHDFVVVASDGISLVRQEFSVAVAGVNQPPRLGSDPPRCADPDVAWEYTVDALDPDGDELRVEVREGPPGMVAEGLTVRWPPAGAGPFEVLLAVVDGQGGEATQRFRLGVRGDGGGAAAPVAQISAPEAGAELGRNTEIRGSASAEPLLHWELTLAAVPAGVPVRLTGGDQPVEDGELGMLPVATLRNGTWELELSVYDTACRATRDRRQVEAGGGLKLGRMKLEHVDMEVQTDNLALRVQRVYDSLDLSPGDFGHGWRLSVSETTLREESEPAPDWGFRSLGGIPPQFALAGKERIVRVPLANDLVGAFVFAPTFTQPMDRYDVSYEYVDLLGLGTTLECLDCPSDLLYVGDELVDWQFRPFEPSRWLVTLAEGTQAELEDDRGLLRLSDRHGNAIDVAPGGLTHSSGDALEIEREAGRVSAVRGPDGAEVGYRYDARGDLVEVRFPDGSAHVFHYFQHRLERVTDATGRTRSAARYDELGRVSERTDADGRSETVHYDDEAGEEVVRDPAGRERRTRYDDNGAVVEQQDAFGHTVLTEHDERGNPVATIDALGQRWERVYDDVRNVTREVGPLGAIDFEYRAAYGELSAVRVDGGATVEVEWAEAGVPTTVRSSTGGLLTFAHDEQGAPVRIEREDGCVSTVERDAGGRPTRVVSDTGAATVEYDAYGRAVRVETPVGVTAVTYDPAGRITRREDPDGSVTERVYDAAGRLVSETSPTGATELRYDGAGRLVRERHEDGTQRSFTYDDLGEVAARAARTGGVTRFTRDAAGRVVVEERPDGSRWQWEFDALGREVRRIDGAGGAWGTDYDAAGRIVRVEDPLGRATTTEWADPGSRRLGGYARSQGPASRTDPLGRTTVWEHEAGNLNNAVRFADGSERRAEHGAGGFVEAEIDEEGRRVSWERDCDGRALAVTDPSGRTARFGWTQEDRLATVTDAADRQTHYEWLPGRRLGRVVLPGGAERRLEYDGPRVVRELDFDGGEVEREWDGQGRELRTTWRGETVERTWGPAGVATIDDGGRHRIRYDDMGRPVRVEYPDGDRVTYAYDAAGRVSEVGTDDATVHYRYDAAGQLTEVEGPGGTTRLAYDAAGRRVATQWPDGATRSTEYDLRDRPVGIEWRDAGGNEVERLETTYDRAGRVLASAELDGSRTVYEYDEGGLLVAETRTGTSPYERRYTYDPAGNRTQAERDGETTSYTYDADDRLVRSEVEGRVTTFSWSEAGWLTGRSGPDGEVRYLRDGRGRLVGVEGGAEALRIRYDAFGNLREVERDGETERFLVEPLLGVPRVLTHAGPGGRSTFDVTPEAILSAHGATAGRPLVDALGTLRGVLGEAGAPVTRQVRTAFGEAVGGETAHLPALGFHGQPGLGGGLFHMGARTYDAGSGRFLSREPLLPRVDAPIWLNAYLYAGANPLTYLDPLGTQSLIGTMISVAVRGVLSRMAIVGGWVLAAARVAWGFARVAVAQSLRFAASLARNVWYRGRSVWDELRWFFMNRGPCTGVSALACNRFLGSTQAARTVAQAFKGIADFRAGLGLTQAQWAPLFQALFGRTVTQIGSVSTSAAMRSLLAANAGRPLLVVQRYANGSHIFFAFADSAGVVLTNPIGLRRTVEFIVYLL